MKPQKGTKVTNVILALLRICLCVTMSCRRSNEVRYDLKGKVVEVEPDKHLVTVSHEEIKGYMPAMTMPYTVHNDADLKILAPDDQITATLVVDGSEMWLEDLIITRQSANPAALATMKIAQPGDEVPNFTLRNQNNREIHIKDYRGKTLLLTFIYTRCPVPEYCTLMSNNFAVVDKQLQQQSSIYDRTHLLSISIDPGYDTPEVLRSYGAAHTERYQNETFAHWEFASGTKDQVKGVAQFFGLRYYEGSDQIVHTLKTVIIGPDGKVAKVYSGNEWKPDEVIQEMTRLAGSS